MIGQLILFVIVFIFVINRILKAIALQKKINKLQHRIDQLTGEAPPFHPNCLCSIAPCDEDGRPEDQ